MDVERWFVERTTGAPEQLRRAATRWWGATPEAPLGERLTAAGQQALEAAISEGATRTAALDLLAADALITLALLAAAERDAATLAATAASYRLAVTPS